MNTIFQFILRGNLDEIDHLVNKLDQFSQESGIDVATKNQVNLILEELFTNSVNYGFKDIQDAQVNIQISLSDGKLEIVYQDNGIAYNPLEIEDPEFMLSVEDMPIGGLGVFFVKAMTDEVQYKRDGRLNILEMLKKV